MVLIKILLHTFLPRVPPDCPWSFLLIHKILHQWLRLIISGADKHKSWWNIAAAPIGSLRVKTQTSHENSFFNGSLGSPTGGGAQTKGLHVCHCSCSPAVSLVETPSGTSRHFPFYLSIYGKCLLETEGSFNLPCEMDCQALSRSSWKVSTGSSAPALAGVMACVRWWQHTQEPVCSHIYPRFFLKCPCPLTLPRNSIPLTMEELYPVLYILPSHFTDEESCGWQISIVRMMTQSSRDRGPGCRRSSQILCSVIMIVL